jgi:hypothetical protein
MKRSVSPAPAAIPFPDAKDSSVRATVVPAATTRPPLSRLLRTAFAAASGTSRRSREFFDAANDEFHFGLDVCATRANGKHTRSDMFAKSTS